MEAALCILMVANGHLIRDGFPARVAATLFGAVVGGLAVVIGVA